MLGISKEILDTVIEKRVSLKCKDQSIKVNIYGNEYSLHLYDLDAVVLTTTTNGREEITIDEGEFYLSISLYTIENNELGWSISDCYCLHEVFTKKVKEELLSNTKKDLNTKDIGILLESMAIDEESFKAGVKNNTKIAEFNHIHFYSEETDLKEITLFVEMGE